MRKNLRILSNNAKFSAGRPLLPTHNFSATMASTSSTYAPIVWGSVTSLKFLATQNMPPQLRIDDWAGGSEWQSYLPDNCHPSSRPMVLDLNCLAVVVRSTG